MNAHTTDAGHLLQCDDSTPVEHIHGPDDGDLLPVRENGRRSNGIYVPVNRYEFGAWRCAAKRFVHDDEAAQ